MRTLSRMYMVLAAMMLAMPIIVVSGAALNSGRSMFFPPQQPTLSRFYEFFWTEDIWVSALQNSLVIALASAATSVLLAWPTAYLLWRTGSRISKILAAFACIPFALPPIVFGIGLGFMWAVIGGLGQIWVGIVSHAVLLTALPLATISIGLQAIDRSHLDAAATMGATRQTALWSIIVPQTLPYTVSGFFFVVIMSFNEFIVMFFVASSAYSTVTLQIFNSLRNGFTPTMAVAAITLITISVFVFGVIARFGDLPKLLGADDSRK